MLPASVDFARIGFALSCRNSGPFLEVSAGVALTGRIEGNPSAIVALRNSAVNLDQVF